MTDSDILFEDKEIIVCRKRAGIPTQTSRIGEPDMESMLKNYLGTPYIGIIHRLDQPVEGLLVFAKTRNAAAKLNAQNKKHIMNKSYYATAVLSEKAETGVGHTLTDYLVKDGKENISKVAAESTPGAKRAELSYRIMKTEQAADGLWIALVRVGLVTGRHHQIRVQLSNAGMPLLGDKKYGSSVSKDLSRKKGVRDVALCAYRLEFFHPATGREMCFEIEPSGGFPVNS